MTEVVEDERPLADLKLEENTEKKENVEEDGKDSSMDNLSKRAKKKMLKRQQWIDTKQERRAKEKEKRKRKMEERRKEGGFEESRSESRKKLKQSKMSESQCKVGVVFDLQFEGLMSQRDLGKTLKQIMKCYSLNRRLANPLQLHMTSFTGRAREEMAKNQGFENWDMNFEEGRYEEALSRDRLVYLTSESEQVITELEGDKCYIIGGIVDHNSQKGLCHREAEALGIPTARLPIDQYMQMRTRKVLTVNHVFEILAAVSQGRGWGEALVQVIPGRKGATVREGALGAEKEEGEVKGEEQEGGEEG